MSEDWTDGDLPDLASEYPDLAAVLGAQPTPTMPDEVWARLESALADQTPLVSADPAVTALAAHRERRPRRVMPLLGAAAGLVLVGVVGVPLVVGGTSSAPPVADSAITNPAEPTTLASGPVATPRSDPPTEPDPAPTTDAITEPAEPTSSPSSEDPITGGADVMTVPARFVLASGTDYSPDAMTPQVTNLLSTAGIGSNSGAMMEEVTAMQADEPAAMPAMVGSAGFTSEPGALRDCVDRLYSSKGGSSAGLAMPALLVDRAFFQGRDAGVVVMLHTSPGDSPYLDVAVVGPECSDADVAAATWFRYDLP